MSDWCMKHGMYFTGHMLHEEHLCTQALCSGSLLRKARGMSMPGTDNLSMGFPGRGVGAKMSVVGTSSQNGAVTPKLISSAAHLSGTSTPRIQVLYRCAICASRTCRRAHPIR